MRRVCRILASLGLAAAAGGCLEAGYVIRLDEDGGGRVTETLGFASRLLRLEARLPEAKGRKIADLLTRERVEERAKAMGEGVSVEDWKLEDTPEGGKRMTTVYRFKDINKLTLCMFPMGHGWDRYDMKFEYSVSNNPKAPWIHLACVYENMIKHQDVTPGWHADRRTLPTVSEQEMQDIRRLLPVFKDMIRGFRLTVRLEVYELSKWASYTRGRAICAHANHISMTGGRETLLDVRDMDLIANDDALLVLASWRQLGNEILVQRMLDLPWQFPYYGKVQFRWLLEQHAESREYY
ncbi:MAG: hypothetical protein N3A38_15140 [Planctomycetota bacterium]|nr:hypothetical protein [Planctomycetota bacterium]